MRATIYKLHAARRRGDKGGVRFSTGSVAGVSSGIAADFCRPALSP